MSKSGAVLSRPRAVTAGLCLLAVLIFAAVAYLLLTRARSPFPLFAAFDPAVKEFQLSAESIYGGAEAQIPSGRRKEIDGLDYQMTFYAFDESKDILLPLMAKQFVKKDGWQSLPFFDEKRATYAYYVRGIHKRKSGFSPEGEFVILCGPGALEDVRKFAPTIGEVPKGRAYLVHMLVEKSLAEKIRETVSGKGGP